MIALITIVHNEFNFLPKWLEYYSSQVDTIHIVNHLDEGSIKPLKDKYKFNESSVDWPVNDIGLGVNMTNEYKNLSNQYLKTHDFLIIADCDEFIVPLSGNIRQYLAKSKDKYVAPMGYEPVQTITEPQIDWNKPILAQRRYWRYTDAESKPCMFREVPNWTTGVHNLINETKKVAKDICLIHCKYIDTTLNRKDKIPVFTETDLEEIPNIWKRI